MKIKENVKIIQCYFDDYREKGRCDSCKKVEKCNSFLSLLRKYDARGQIFWKHFLVWLSG